MPVRTEAEGSYCISDCAHEQTTKFFPQEWEVRSFMLMNGWERIWKGKDKPWPQEEWHCPLCVKDGHSPANKKTETEIASSIVAEWLGNPCGDDYYIVHKCKPCPTKTLIDAIAKRIKMADNSPPPKRTYVDYNHPTPKNVIVECPACRRRIEHRHGLRFICSCGSKLYYEGDIFKPKESVGFRSDDESCNRNFFLFNGENPRMEIVESFYREGGPCEIKAGYLYTVKIWQEGSYYDPDFRPNPHTELIHECNLYKKKHLVVE